MYTLKSIAKRGFSLTAVAAFVVAAIMPASVAFADSLNPLTERSLTLSSSSPGWAYTDGSGNSTYAPPNSGANGQKTGNYFSFKVSTDTTASGTNTPIKAMSFQYCTAPAGQCIAPGDDSSHGTDTATTADLNIAYSTAKEIGDTSVSGATAGDFGTVIDTATGNVKAVPGYTNHNPKYSGSGDPAEAAKAVPGSYLVMHYDPTANSGAGAWVQDTGWTVSTSTQEEATGTGQQNTLILQNSTGVGYTSGTQVKVLFFANDTNYITNPGSGAFFVKINTFKAFTALAGPTDLATQASSNNVIDGGVTVANVMNQSIQITTKVLETMEFSVGTVDPDTLDSSNGNATTLSDYEAAEGKTLPSGTDPHASHGVCDLILKGMLPTDPHQNVLQFGDQTSESSLSTKETYATHSYWRLSSNSSAGATVYYSGHTLSNTSGDEITPMDPSKHLGAAQQAHPGSEQFGLAIDTKALTPISGTVFNNGTYGVDYSQDRGGTKNYENAADNGKTVIHDSTLTDLGAVLTPTADYTNLNGSYHTPRLDPLTPVANYGGGSGTINGADSSATTGASPATFAFDPMSDTVPAPIASENSQVVDCVTAKMRYIANIAATTPAGIYTSKINYIAAPQY